MSVGHRVDPTQAAAEERVGAWMARALVAIAALAGLGLVLPGGGWLDGAAILAITALPSSTETIAVIVPICAPSRRYSTRSTAAPLPPCAVAEIVSGTLGVARAVAFTLGAVIATVGVPKAELIVTVLEMVLFPRSSVAMASIT